MDQTALALFRNQTQVDLIFQKLQDCGLSPSRLKSFSTIGKLSEEFTNATTGTNADDRYADTKSELFQALQEWGVPKEDALLFTEGVRRGGKLVVIFTSHQNLDLISQILKQHGALDLDTRKRFTEEMRQLPTKGLSKSPFTKISQESHFAHDFAEWLCEHKSETGPRSAVKIYEKPPSFDGLHLERNLNE